MTTLKVQYERSGFVWYTEVTTVKQVLPTWDVKDESVRLDPLRGLQTRPGAERHTMWDNGVTLTEDVVQSSKEMEDFTPAWADHAIPNVIHQGVFGDNQRYASLLVVKSKSTPDPYREFGVVIPAGYCWMMNDQGDTIDRI